ncbi:sulfur carrier protein ThiS [Ehrlichia muris]|uniref:ThiS, thiamine-biosynthesis n=1 Tax=Ehrlichia muris AS145 TaxID=1423892 RepID=V9R9E1_9RICK|nr:sulfur carrier protein ThiS [Ehrlichia muris]AHC39511.1 ThiS, thiamine-biosynthesis [Ehrlichia muris AS145]
MLITIVINQNKMLFKSKLTLSEILDECGYNTDLPFAVAVNKSLVVRDKYNSTYLNNGDIVDIVYPMQGG